MKTAGPPTYDPGSSTVIVVVDDDPALLAALKFAFETDGFAVVAFSDAEAMLAAPRPKRICLVFDQHLPGMSGLDMLDRLRASEADTPAIMITTGPSVSTRARALMHGVSIVEKPLLNDALRREVKRIAFVSDV